MDIQSYEYRPTELFSSKLEKIRSHDPVGHSRINSVIERLLHNPADADGKMTGIYNGRFKKYVGRKDYRLIYYYCELCRKENKRLEERCEGCHVLPDRAVIFFDLYHKNEAKKFKRGQRD